MLATTLLRSFKVMYLAQLCGSRTIRHVIESCLGVGAQLYKTGDGGCPWSFSPMFNARYSIRLVRHRKTLDHLLGKLLGSITFARHETPGLHSSPLPTVDSWSSFLLWHTGPLMCAILPAYDRLNSG